MKNSLQFRMVALIVLFSFITASLVGAANMYLSINAAKRNAFESNKTIANQVSSEIERFMGGAQGLVEALAASPTAYSMDPAGVREMIISAQQRNPQFELIFVMDTAGMQIARTSGTLANRGSRPYFKEAMNGKTFFTDTYISAFTNAPTITISTPIKNQAGNIVGVFAADISLKAIWEMASRTPIGQGGYIDVVDHKGTLIAHPNTEKVLKNESVAALPYVQTVIAGKAGNAEAESTTGVASVVAYAPMKMLQWGVITYLPSSEITAIMMKSLLTMLVIIVLALLLAAFSSIYVARGITRPISILAGAADQIAEGHLNRAISVSGVTEVDQLASSLEKMRQGLLSIVTHIMQSAEQIAASSEELTASAEQSAQATDQVANAITEVVDGVTRQTKSLDSTAAVTEQMSAGVQEIAANASVVEGMTEKATAAAEAGRGAVEAAVQQMRKIEESVSSSAAIVAKLGDSSHQIGEIIGTIAGIASQTNLLALNAAIEAARAGEQGRGFAVVAEEVRKLAEGSEQAARQIADIISQIQTDTENAVVAMSQGTQEVGIGANVVHSAGTAFNDIAAQISGVSNQIKEIAAAIAELAQGSQHIVSSVREIDQVSKGTAEQTETVSAATQEQAAAMQEIASSSHALSMLAEDLQQSIRRFTV